MLDGVRLSHEIMWIDKQSAGAIVYAVPSCIEHAEIWPAFPRVLGDIDTAVKLSWQPNVREEQVNTFLRGQQRSGFIQIACRKGLVTHLLDHALCEHAHLLSVLHNQDA